MADFELEFPKLIIAEGYFSDDYGDKGGITYLGISSVYHPTWEGFKIINEEIDKLNYLKTKDKIALGQALTKRIELVPLAKAFYKVAFWDQVSLDLFPQELADEIFDSFVNCGGVAISWLQQILNALNFDIKTGSTYFPDLIPDGLAGSKTSFAFKTILEKRSLKTSPIINDIYNTLNAFQKVYYAKICVNNPDQRLNYDGWNLRTDFNMDGVPSYSIKK